MGEGDYSKQDYIYIELIQRFLLINIWICRGYYGFVYEWYTIS